jgi:small subunit ribosomal protein S6
MDVRKYESIVVFNPKLNDSQLKEEIKKVEGILTNQDAKMIGVDTWGKKEVSYLVKKERFGHYVVFNYESANHQAPNELTTVLRITENVQKFQTHVINSKVRKFRGNPKRAGQRDSDSDDFDFGSDSYE